MKKIINSGSLLLLAFLLSCGSNEKKVDKETVTVPAINQIVGIGKVLPEDGIITLSVGEGEKVVKLYKKLGDHVQAGEALFSMEQVRFCLGVV